MGQETKLQIAKLKGNLLKTKRSTNFLVIIKSILFAAAYKNSIKEKKQIESF